MAEEATTTLSQQSKEQHRERNEVRSGQLLRWALWAWSKTVCITESQQVKRGIEAILQGKKKEAEITQRPLEDNNSRSASKRSHQPQS